MEENNGNVYVSSIFRGLTLLFALVFFIAGLVSAYMLNFIIAISVWFSGALIIFLYSMLINIIELLQKIADKK